MAKIKVLHIIKSLGRGGAEVLLPETLKLHDKTLFEFQYIYFLPWKNQMVKSIQESGGKVLLFPAKNNLQLIFKSFEVISYCKREKIDVVHCHLPWSGLVGRIIFQKTKLPVIYTEHNIQERYHFVTKFLNRLTYNYQSIALGVSKDVTRSIKQKISPSIPVLTLLNGVNTHFFRKNKDLGNEIRRKYGIPRNAVVIGNIAVFRKQKSIRDWVKAFKEVNLSKVEIYGLLVGAGPEEQAISEYIQELGLERKIIMTGLQSDTIPFFSAMDIFMLSSKFEGLPVALLEAMSMNLAIVSTKAGGVVEVITDEQDGLLCEVGDWKGLAQRVLKLSIHEDQRTKFQTASRRRVEESFSLKKMVQSLEAIYSEEWSKRSDRKKAKNFQ